MIRERELFVIDNPLQAHLLIAKLKAALPLPALATSPLLAQLHEQAPGRDLSPRCQITGIHYAGDEGGILCKLDFGTEDADPVFFVSITHLTFDRRLPRGSRDRDLPEAPHQAHPSRNPAKSTGGVSLRQRV